RAPGRDVDCSGGVERGRVAEGQRVRAVAHDQAVAVVTQAPTLALVRHLVADLERLRVAVVGDPLAPGQGPERVRSDGAPLPELALGRRRPRGRPVVLDRAPLDLCVPVPSGRLVELIADHLQPLREQRRIVRDGPHHLHVPPGRLRTLGAHRDPGALPAARVRGHAGWGPGRAAAGLLRGATGVGGARGGEAEHTERGDEWADGAGEAAHASRMPHGGPVRDVDTMTRIMGAVDTEAVTDQASDFDDALRARLTDAVDVARTAVEEFASDGVGEHLDAIVEAPFTTTHRFVSELPGYRGWHWACVLALVPGGEVTIDEISLLPGEGAVVAPEWVPWEKRIRPGDLGAGDLLPPSDDDER